MVSHHKYTATLAAVLSLLQLSASTPTSNPSISGLVLSTTENDDIFNETAILETRDKYSTTKWTDFGEFPGSKSARGYQDGEGTYIRSGDDSREGIAGLGHCWTDYVSSLCFYSSRFLTDTSP